MSDGVPVNQILQGDCLKAPFPWFGGKSTVADLVWERLNPNPQDLFSLISASSVSSAVKEPLL